MGLGLAVCLSFLLALPTFTCAASDGHSHRTNWIFHGLEDIASALWETGHDHSEHKHGLAQDGHNSPVLAYRPLRDQETSDPADHYHLYSGVLWLQAKQIRPPNQDHHSILIRKTLLKDTARLEIPRHQPDIYRTQSTALRTRTTVLQV